MRISIIIFLIVIAAGSYFIYSYLPISSPGEKESPQISFVIREFLSDSPAMIADELGYYADEGLKVDTIIVEKGRYAAPFILSGEAQFAMLGGKWSVLTQLQDSNNEIEIIADLGGGGGRWRLMARKNSDISALAELNNKKVGSWLDSYGFSKFMSYLNEQNIDITPIQLGAMAPKAALAPLEEGIVDAVLVWEPIPSLIEENEAGYQVFTMEEVGGEMSVYLHAQKGFIKEYPEAPQGIFRALQRAQDFIRENPSEAAEIIFSKRHILNASLSAVEAGLSYIDFAVRFDENEEEEFNDIVRVFQEAGIHNLPDEEFIKLNGEYIKRYNRVQSPVLIGYFHGGRVNMIYRTYINDYFEKEGVNVKLYTKFLRGEEVFEVPKSENEKKEMAKAREKSEEGFGKMSGIEIVEKIAKGEFNGGTIGESSFVASISRGIPLVAVAQLGYDAVPGKAIIMRDDIEINSSDDFRGKTLISRRAGPGDAIFLREFIKDIGLDPDNDLTIIDQVYEDDGTKWLKEKIIDGGLYHLGAVRQLVLSGDAYVYRPMNWMNPQLSHSLLVFHKDYIESHKEAIQKIVNAYMKRIAYENNIPEEEKDRSWNKGLMMDGEFQGVHIPIYDMPPKIRIGLLEEMQDLLLEYGEIDKKIDIKNFIDHSFIENSEL